MYGRGATDAGPCAGSQRIFDRRFELCDYLQSFEHEELIRYCPDCNQFFAFCCQHKDSEEYKDKPCHRWSLIFTDGACLSNGNVVARAGVGVALGMEEDQQFALSVDDSMDPGAKRTSQRAELLAALKGLRIRSTWEALCYRPPSLRHSVEEEGNKQWIIATDSEYVVKGMTEWLPRWRANGWRTAQNTRPANLDLFLRLDEAIEEEMTRGNRQIAFWHVPRTCNTIADRLAKEAARLAEPQALHSATR